MRVRRRLRRKLQLTLAAHRFASLIQSDAAWQNLATKLWRLWNGNGLSPKLDPKCGASRPKRANHCGASSVASRKIASRTAISIGLQKWRSKPASRLLAKSCMLHRPLMAIACQGRRPASLRHRKSSHPSPSGKEMSLNNRSNASFSETASSRASRTF